MAYEPHFIIFAHPRSGSSSLLNMLRRHPHLKMLEEPFHEHFTQWAPGEPEYRALIHDQISLDAQLHAIFSRYNGIKVLDYQLPIDLYTHMLQQTGYKVIFLRRRNLLQAVVSAAIAHQTNLWQKWDAQQPLDEYYVDLKPLSVSDIRDHVASLHERLNYFAAILRSREPTAVLQIMYEDLYFGTSDEQERQLQRLWSFLGIDPLPIAALQTCLRPDRAKLNSASTYRYVPNIDDINRQLGNDETGWLF